MKTQIRLALLITGLLYVSVVQGQHFGRNKVVYDQFRFRIYQTPNFDIYHYLEDEEEIERFAQLCERWYRRHLEVFRDTLRERSPIILYNNHADFQQTTVIQQLIGVGVGGVTEGIRQRVVMPLAATRRETDHVLGHELVHVFQFNRILRGDTLAPGFQGLQNLPLWVVEGMAEYLSEGSQHVQTALWMRDAVRNDDIPTITQLTTEPNNYFPYRYGHSFLAFFGRVYGDDQVLPLLFQIALRGYRQGFQVVTGIPVESLSELWAQELREAYEPWLEGRQEHVGQLLFDASNAGTSNIAPSISPDGRSMVFVSNRDLVSMDFFLADIEQRQITRQISGVMRETRIDDYSFLESAGTWHPQGNQFALAVFMEGENRLLIADLDARRRSRTHSLEGISAFNNPDWSPDGSSIVVSGQHHGKSNLYLFDVQTGQTRQLTDDPYDALHPHWSPDGSRILFVTDRGSTHLDVIDLGYYRLAEYEMQTGQVRVFDILPGADIINPVYSGDGSQIFFVSDADGFRNIYRYDIAGQQLHRLTNLQTGVIGITAGSPCLDISWETNQLIYTLYNNGNYEIYSCNIDDLDGEEFSREDIDFTAALLPPFREMAPTTFVDDNLLATPVWDSEVFATREYESRFTLEHVGASGIGIGVSQFGTGMAGGVNFMFSDMLRENTLLAGVQLQGRIFDVAGQFAYLNQRTRFNWGAIVSHFPYRFAGAGIIQDTLQGQVVNNLVMLEERVFESELGGYGIYPLSRNLRFEGGISGRMYNFRRDSINNYYAGGVPVHREEFRVEAPGGFFLYRGYLAYVGDGSQFGFTAPMDGYRYRFQVDRTMGEYSFWGLMADYRRYYLMRPFSFGYRLMHYGRYGDDANQLQPLFLGAPYFVRGYTWNNLRQPSGLGDNIMSINNLTGSKMAVINLELRLPFTGIEELALIRSRMFFSDLVLFTDGGLAWYDFDNIVLQWTPNNGENVRIPVVSSGLALRVNLFGAIIVEPYLAIPFQRRADNYTPTFGFHMSMGGF